MNITLRKANAIQNSINEAIRNIKVDLSLEINEFQDPAAELTKANTALVEADGRRQKLLLALYNIRGLVGQANAASGIDLNLAKAAFIDKRIVQLTAFASAEAATDIEVIKGKLEKIKNDKGETSRRSIYSYTDTVNSSVLDISQIHQARTEILNLKKQKQKLNDEVLELNIKTEIPLSEDVVTTLTTEGLI